MLRLSRTSSPIHSLRAKPRCASLPSRAVRAYETILQPRQPPAVNFQLNKLQSLNASRAAASGLYSRLIRFNQWSCRHPLLLATSIATLRAAVCDWMAQCGIQGRDRDSFNYDRLALFTLFGFVYSGCGQFLVYNRVYPALFSHLKRGFVRSTASTVADMVVHSPLIYFPVFYVFKGCVYERRVSVEVAQRQLHEYFVLNFKSDMKALYAVWLPTIAFMFAAVPVQFHVPWISAVAIGWSMFMSIQRGDAHGKDCACSDCVAKFKGVSTAATLDLHSHSHGQDCACNECAHAKMMAIEGASHSLHRDHAHGHSHAHGADCGCGECAMKFKVVEAAAAHHSHGEGCPCNECVHSRADEGLVMPVVGGHTQRA